jgi:hypothetical protein
VKTPEDIRLLPEVDAGYARPLRAGAEDWVAVAWLLSAELRALLEDFEGGLDQPELRRVVELRMLEVLLDVDARMLGLVPPGTAHTLALALEYGMRAVLQADGEDLLALSGLDQGLDRLAEPSGALARLGARLVEEFPGPLPDRLVAESEGHIRECMTLWAGLVDHAGGSTATLHRLVREC